MDFLYITKQICREYNIRPARSKGQNFLIDEKVYDKIIETAKLEKDDIVLEVGPGLGFLTERLALKVKRVIAVELDDKLVNVLKARLKEQGIENVTVVNEDVLKTPPPAPLHLTPSPSPRQERVAKGGEKRGGYKIVANLPYNITSYFLRKYLSSDMNLESMTLLLQKEVAERITARPGKMSLLAVSVQYYSEPKIVDYVSREAFWPKPDVDSAINRLIPHPSLSFWRPKADRIPKLTGKATGSYRSVPLRSTPLQDDNLYSSDRQEGETHPTPIPSGHPSHEGILEKEFFRLVKIGFSARRKMLKNNLADGLRISQVEAGNRIKMAGFSEKIRAQELSVNDWAKLFDYFNKI